VSDFRDTDVKKPGWEIHIFDNDILIGLLLKTSTQYSTVLLRSVSSIQTFNI